MIELAALCEAAAIDQLVLPDHVAMGARLDRYPYGRFPLPEDEPWLEPMTALAAMAARTERVRLATGVLIGPLRSALLLAKTAATLDVLSRGRLDLGVGFGWQPEEFAGSPMAFEGRGRRFADALRACRALWSGDATDFQSDSLSFEGLRSLPRPVQEGGVPLWFGVALTDANLRRIAELGQGWLPLAPDLEDVAAGGAQLREAFASAGRDPTTLGVRANAPLVLDGRRPDLDATLAGLGALAEAGVTVAAIPLAAFARTRDDIGAVIERIGGAARP